MVPLDAGLLHSVLLQGPSVLGYMVLDLNIESLDGGSRYVGGVNIYYQDTSFTRNVGSCLVRIM